MSDKAQLQALGAKLKKQALQVIYDNDGINGIKIHETMYSPGALAALAGDVARLSAALATIADAHPFDPCGFARAVLAGKSVDDALAADVAEMNRPNTAEEQVQVMREFEIAKARVELTNAALRFDQADWMCTKCKALDEMLDAIKAFKAASGSEVTE